MQVHPALAQLAFPILLLDRGDLDMVFDLEHFMVDMDQSFRRKEKYETAIDALGQEWTWTYIQECNVPDRVVRVWDLDQCKDLLRKWFKGVRIEKRILAEVDSATSIKDLFDRVGDFF
jgi:hypothetical protein